jgi:hypothetical protein
MLGRLVLKILPGTKDRILQEYYNGFPPVKGRDGLSWSCNMLCHIFSHWNLLWESRNKERHGHGTKTHNIAHQDQAIWELEVLYTFRKSVLHRDCSIFCDTLDEQKKQPNHVIRQWINTYQPLLLKSTKDAKTASLLHVRSISHYFGKIS